MNIRHLKLWTWIVVALGTVQGLLYALTTKLGPDQIQMLYKGVKLAHLGVWTHHGNVVTGGGSVPGSLSTFIVGFPLMIHDSGMAPQVFITFLHLGSLWLLNEALKNHFTPLQRFVFICLFWLSPWRASKAILWNPCYLFFATALHFYTAKKLSERPTFWMSFWHLFAIGYAFQLHTSSVILAFVSAYLFFRKMIQVKWSGIATSMALIILSLVPFYLETLQSKELMPVVQKDPDRFFYGFGFVYVYPLIKGVLYWPRYSSFIFPSYIFNNLDYSLFQPPWLSSTVRYSFDGLRYLLGGLSMIFTTWGFVWTVKTYWKKKNEKFRMPSLVDNYIIACLIAMVLAVGMSPAEMSHWHLFLLLPIAQIAFCQFFFSKLENWQWSESKTLKVILGLSLYLALYNGTAIFTAKQYYSIDDNLPKKYKNFKSQVREDW